MWLSDLPISRLAPKHTVHGIMNLNGTQALHHCGLARQFPSDSSCSGGAVQGDKGYDLQSHYREILTVALGPAVCDLNQAGDVFRLSSLCESAGIDCQVHGHDMEARLTDRQIHSYFQIISQEAQQSPH